MAPILTAEDVVRRVGHRMRLDDHLAVGISVESATAIVRQYRE
jgi:hypothetical protein